MQNGTGWIWLDGEFVPWKEAKVHVLTHTFHYGMGVFEGVRAYKTDAGTAIFRLDDHTRRLLDSAKILRMNISYTREELNDIQKEVLRKNKLQTAYIRPMAFYGSENMGLHAKDLEVHIMVAAWEWGTYLGAENIETGIRVGTSSFARHHINVTMSKAKANGNYLNSILALHEASDAGYDEALLLDVDGYVAEGSGENIFIVHNGELLTPDLSSALDGITRRTIIELAKARGYEVIEQRLTRDRVYIADEAFFTGTAAEVVPIRELDHRTIGNGKRGPITNELQSLYFDVVHGRDKKYQGWLAYL